MLTCTETTRRRFCATNETGAYQTLTCWVARATSKTQTNSRRLDSPSVSGNRRQAVARRPLVTLQQQVRVVNILTGDYQPPADSPTGKRAARIALQQEGERASQEERAEYGSTKRQYLTRQNRRNKFLTLMADAVAKGTRAPAKPHPFCFVQP